MATSGLRVVRCDDQRRALLRSTKLILSDAYFVPTKPHHNSVTSTFFNSFDNSILSILVIYIRTEACLEMIIFPFVSGMSFDTLP